MQNDKYKAYWFIKKRIQSQIKDSDDNEMIAQISNNEKYLAYGCYNKIMKIYGLSLLILIWFILLYVALWNDKEFLFIIIGMYKRISK